MFCSDLFDYTHQQSTSSSSSSMATTIDGTIDSGTTDGGANDGSENPTGAAIQRSTTAKTIPGNKKRGKSSHIGKIYTHQHNVCAIRK